MCWHTVTHGRGSEGGNWRMEGVDSTLHSNSEHGVSSITTAEAHTSAASSRLNWRPRRFKWTRPFRRKTKSGFCACAITFQLASTNFGHWHSGSRTRELDTDSTNYCHTPRPRARAHNKISTLFSVFQKKTLFEWLPSQNSLAFLTSPSPAAFLAHNKFFHYKVFCVSWGLE